MRMLTMNLISGFAAAAFLACAVMPANAKRCGNDASGFNQWIADFRVEAMGKGFSKQTLDEAFNGIRYATGTIRMDRSAKGFNLSFDQFMKRRGAATIVAQGRKHKQRNAQLFANIEARFGVPAGPLIAIWGMETAFGHFSGDKEIFPALATLAYDCRRSELFEEQLYGALTILQTGQLSKAKMRGAGHGELGQMQFLPANYVKYGVDGDGDGRVDMVSSRADALASTANYLRSYGWAPGAGYQPGEPNFAAIQGWNKAGVYQKAIASIAKSIDG